MTTKQRERVFALTAAISLAILVGDRVLLSPLQDVWAKRSERIGELKESLDKGRLLVGRKDAVVGKWDDMKRGALPAEQSSAEDGVLKSVDRWVQISRLNVTSLRPQWTQPEETKDDFAELSCRVAAHGDMESITRFLYEIERDPLALRVEEIDIEARDNSGRDLSLAVRFSGLVLPEREK
jgi:hypothetical protein